MQPHRRRYKRGGRTTIDQLHEFLTFVEKNPEVFRPNAIKKDVNYVSIKWHELAILLNSLRGPKKKPYDWRISLFHWRNQLKSRVRKLRAEQMIKTEGANINLSLSTLEMRALTLFGELPIGNGDNIRQKNSVDSRVNETAYMESTVQDIKLESELDISELENVEMTHLGLNLLDGTSQTTKSVETYEDFTGRESSRLLSPSQINTVLEEEALRPMSKNTGEQIQNESTFSGKTDQSNQYVESREEFDKRMTEENLKIERLKCEAQNTMANAVSKMADALLIFANAYAKK